MSGAPVTKNMVHLPGGRYQAGDDRFYPEEGPVHDVEVGAMWIDEHPVTNAGVPSFRAGHRPRDGAELAADDEREFPDAVPPIS